MRARLNVPFGLGWRLWKEQPKSPMGLHLRSCPCEMRNRNKDPSASPRPGSIDKSNLPYPEHRPGSREVRG